MMPASIQAGYFAGAVKGAVVFIASSPVISDAISADNAALSIA